MARPKGFDPDAVLDCIVEVFRELGFAGASLDELSSRTGIGRQSLYDTFGSKERLWALALARYRERQGAAMLDSLDAEDVLAGLRGVLAWLIHDTCADPWGCLVVAAAAERVPADVASTHQVTEQFQALATALAAAIRRGQALGQIRAELDAVVHAELLLAVSQGIRIIGKVRPDPHRLGRAADAVLDAMAA